MNYINFWIDGISMKDHFKIIRISEGGGFSMNLSPNFSIKMESLGNVPNMSYYGKSFSESQITIPFAIDGSLTEQEMQNLKKFLFPDTAYLTRKSLPAQDIYHDLPGKDTRIDNLKDRLDKGIRELTFDEFPILHYDVILASTPTFNFNVYTNKDQQRIYKGTGSITFTLKNHYRYCSANEPIIQDPFMIEWKDALFPSDLDFSAQGNKIPGSAPISSNDLKWSVINYGDIETPMLISLSGLKEKDEVTVSLDSASKTIVSFTVPKNTPYIMIDEETMSIYSYDKGINSIIFQEFIPFTGDFQKLPLNEHTIIINKGKIDFVKFKNYFL